MRRLSGTAAALVLALTVSACTGAGTSRAHSCGATDKRFLETASLNLTSLDLSVTGYRRGEIAAGELVEEAFAAAERVRYVEPNDPSLRKAQKLLAAMLSEYGEAVALEAKGVEAGQRIHRAYGLANSVRDVLAKAQPELSRRGCDVAALL